LSPMELRSWLIDHMVVNPWVISGCSKRSLGQAKVYTQKEGEDFFDTYSPVARLTTIHVLFSLAVSHGLLVHQMDVKTSFLNGELEEEIYMTQLDGFVIKGQEDMVCKLQNSLYGLKQKPKQWHEKFNVTLISAGFSVNEAD
jgi:hypothetical protein